MSQKRHILFLFVDGIGLGDDDSETNPFSIAEMPTLISLTNGKRWLKDTGKQVSSDAIFIPTDPRLGVAGRPQSGSSHAVIVTGKNVPEMLGRHYGPLPNEPIRNLLDKDNFFITVKQRGGQAGLLSAYPPRRLAGIASGKRLPSSIQYAAIASGQNLFTKDDVIAGYALTAEYTTQSWQEYLGIDNLPSYSPQEAGRKLAQLSRNYDFAFHSQWMSDYIGHRGTIEQASSLLEKFDRVVAGVLDEWQDDEGLIIITSDHGNMEAMAHRKHTENDVPTLIIGKGKEDFADGFGQLLDFVPRMERYLFGE
jgi:2,3-bisphosphoglycerate-independent phosphoglycerate mutase